MSQVAQNTLPSPGLAAQAPASPSQPSPPQTTPETNVSPKLEMLIRREKVALERERAAKQKELEFQKRYEEFTEREKKLKEWESLRESDPYKALEAVGWDHNRYTQAVLNDGKLPPEAKIAELEGKLNNLVKTQEEALLRRQEEEKRAQEKRQEGVLEQFKRKLQGYINDNGSKYEYIHFDQAHDAVYDVISNHYSKTLKEAQEKAEAEGRDPSLEVGIELTFDEAAEQVEKTLEQKYEKLRALKKFQTSLAPKPGAFLDALKVQPERQTPKTITNAMAPTQAHIPQGIETDEQRIARAIAPYLARGFR